MRRSANVSPELVAARDLMSAEPNFSDYLKAMVLALSLGSYTATSSF